MKQISKTYIKAVLTSGPQKVVIHFRSCLIQVKDTAVFECVPVTTGAKIHGHATLEFPSFRIIE